MNDRLLLRLTALAAISVGLALGQQQGGGAGGTGTGGTGAGGTGTGTGAGGIGTGAGGRTLPTIPSTTTTQPNNFPDVPRPIFISGKVMLSEGGPPPEPVAIERVCGGRVFPEGFTDLKGRFSFELGRNLGGFVDASMSSGSEGGFGGGGSSRSNPLTTGSTGSSSTIGMTDRKLFGCELRAALPGFRSDSVNLSNRRSMDNPDVGIIILKRLANVEGLTISATTYAAPKDSKKAYDKARELLKKNKMDEAKAQFEKAVEGYPKYAVAWFELGRIHEIQGKSEEANKAYNEALKADSKLIMPYERLAALAIREQKWQDAADISERMIRLNPVDFPSAFFYNALANLNLKNLDVAEKTATELLKLDPQHRVPKGEHLMAVILAQKQDFPGAAQHFKAFLQFAAPGSDVELAKKQLAEVEKTLGASNEAKNDGKKEQ